jgi:hypothetical protein
MGVMTVGRLSSWSGLICFVLQVARNQMSPEEKMTLAERQLTVSNLRPLLNYWLLYSSRPPI